MRFAGNLPHNAHPHLVHIFTVIHSVRIARADAVSRLRSPKATVYSSTASTEAKIAHSTAPRAPRARAHAFGAGKRSIDILDGAAPGWTSRSSRSSQKRIYR